MHETIGRRGWLTLCVYACLSAACLSGGLCGTAAAHATEDFDATYLNVVTAARAQFKPEVTIAEHHIELAQPVLFAPNRKRVRSRFREELIELARVINARGDLGVIAIEGHADATGPARWNLELSRRRAQQIVDFLVAHEVPAQRLRAVGFGEAQPLAPARTRADERERRVQFFTEVERPSPRLTENRPGPIAAATAGRKPVDSLED